MSFQIFGILFLKLLIDHRQPTLSMQKSAFHEMRHFDFSLLTGVSFESKHTLVLKKFRSRALKSGPYTARLSKAKLLLVLHPF